MGFPFGDDPPPTSAEYDELCREHSARSGLPPFADWFGPKKLSKTDEFNAVVEAHYWGEYGDGWDEVKALLDLIKARGL